MHAIAGIVSALDNAQTQVWTLALGVGIYVISTLRFGWFKTIHRDDRPKLQRLSIPFLVVGFTVLILAQINGG